MQFMFAQIKYRLLFEFTFRKRAHNMHHLLNKICILTLDAFMSEDSARNLLINYKRVNEFLCRFMQ